MVLPFSFYMLVAVRHHVSFLGIIHSYLVKIEKIAERSAHTADQASPGMLGVCPRNYRHRQAVPAG
jgi:hypothetical protein